VKLPAHTGSRLIGERRTACPSAGRILAIAALCALVPSVTLAQTGSRMGPGMMDTGPVGRTDSNKAPPPKPASPEQEPQTTASAQMAGSMGHQAAPNPFYREWTFLALVALALAVGGLVIGYRITRTRGTWRRGGTQFVTEAVLVVDLVQSTHLATHYGDGLAMKARIVLKDRTLAVAKDQGLVFSENTGDGYFMTFDSVAKAIRAAFALLADLKARPPDLGPAPPLAVRVGISYGEILLDARGGRHGAVINKAFRLEGVSRDAFVQLEGNGDAAAIPERNRVFIGEDAAEEARSGGFSLTPVGICALKGFSGLHRVYQALP